jgi:hypothetical protein
VAELLAAERGVGHVLAHLPDGDAGGARQAGDLTEILGGVADGVGEHRRRPAADLRGLDSLTRLAQPGGQLAADVALADLAQLAAQPVGVGDDVVERQAHPLEVGDDPVDVGAAGQVRAERLGQRLRAPRLSLLR